MENKYLFILWDRALFCKDRIIKDLSDSFSIESVFYIIWTDKNYTINLKSLYGHRLGPVKEKNLACGKGKFLLIIVEDKKPIFENKQLYDGQTTINKNIFEKKQLYRRWTAGSNRIHCSNNTEELNHDLVVLFGKDYKQIISSISDYDIVNLDTKTANSFENIKDIKNCLKLFGNNVLVQKGDDVYIFCYCRRDIEYFLATDTIKDNNLVILGELEGYLPDNTFALIKENHTDIIDCIVNDYPSYSNYLDTRTSLPEEIKNLFIRYGLDTDFKPKQTDRKTSVSVYLNMIKNEVPTV